MQNQLEIKVIGVGGVGTCLLPVLLRYLNFQYSHSYVTLIDGDSFEPRNIERQSFNRIGNKAEVKVEELAGQFDRLELRAIPEFITPKNARKYIYEGDIIFMGVDNHKTRKQVTNQCRKLKNVVLISGGNELTDGNVQIYIRKNGKDLTLPLDNEDHPEIANPEDRNPSEFGCGEIIESNPQIVLMNNLVATEMLTCFFAYLEGNLTCDEIFFDMKRMTRRVVRNSPVV